MSNDDDELPILASISENVKICDCCGKSNLKRTICIDGPDITKHLGVVCAGQWFEINLTGNYWYAAERLTRKLRKMSNKEISNIIAEIEA